MRSRSVRRTTILFALLIVVLLGSAVVSYRTTTQIADGENWLIHTYTVLDSLNSLEAAVRSSANRVDLYAATGDADALSTAHMRLARADEIVTSLNSLVQDNPAQLANLAALKPLLSQWQNQMDSFADQGRKDLHRTGSAVEQVRQSLNVIATMRNLESSLLQARSQTTEISLRSMHFWIFAAATGNLIFLLVAGLLIARGEKLSGRERESQLLMASIVDSSDDAIIGKTLEGIITSWNHGAQKFYGYAPEEAIGKSINLIIPPERQAEMQNIFDTLKAGHQVDHLETVRVRRDGTRIEVELTVSPIRNDQGQVIGASAIARDITERNRLNESIRQLSARILQAQDEERRRIARELHDTTVQKLALLSMDLATLRSPGHTEKVQKTATHGQELAGQCVQELRTLSYILHPPMLDELGLASALKIYAEGFSQRSGLQLDIDVDSDWERLSPEMEIALFRVAQESLSNVVRHSGSDRAKIRLVRNGEIKLEVIDHGRGIPTTNDGAKKITYGVGILGMTERMKQLGGSLHVASSSSGTLVEARLPYSRRMDGEDPNLNRG